METRQAAVGMAILILGASVSGVILDVDGDGVDTGTEAITTANSPFVADSDANGVGDGRERALGSDPTDDDADSDGLPGPTEASVGTGLAIRNADADGLADPRELNESSSDPVVADTGGDALDDNSERALGTNAVLGDTDGDGVADGRELSGLGTDPTAADTDGDGLDDGREFRAGTDPLVADTDGDGLADGREVEVGTNATVADTDGDRLADGAEVRGETADGAPLPDANPLRMDVYVIAVNGTDEPLPEHFDGLRRSWAAANVTNPDGSTGVTLHVERASVDRAIALESDDVDPGTLYSMYSDVAGARAGVYHVQYHGTTDRPLCGWGSVGGHVSFVRTGGGRCYPEKAALHELLHNVLGRLDRPGDCGNVNHPCEGGLTSRRDWGWAIPPDFVREIADDGFQPRGD